MRETVADAYRSVKRFFSLIQVLRWRSVRRPHGPPGAAVGGRSRKGARTSREIQRSAVEIIGQFGSAAASQEQIARRAGISQSTLRHHYPTKEALVDAVYAAAFDGYRASFEALLLEPGHTPAERLLRLVQAHLDYIAQHDDAYTFESFAHIARSAAARHNRDTWYAWLVDHYQALVLLIRPAADPAQARAIAFQILTLTLGAWITFGRSRPKLLGRAATEAREALLHGVEALVGVALRA